jgi:hypothetical protein
LNTTRVYLIVIRSSLLKNTIYCLQILEGIKVGEGIVMEAVPGGFQDFLMMVVQAISHLRVIRLCNLPPPLPTPSTSTTSYPSPFTGSPNHKLTDA